MPSVGPLEILVVLVVAVLVFPPHKLPDIARQVARALSELRSFQRTVTKDLEHLVSEPDETPKLPPKASGPQSPEHAPTDGDDGAQRGPADEDA